MGNVLTTSHPQELLSVQAYLQDITYDDSIENLGSTRFMKVARAATSAGCQVWKVFISHDDCVNLSIYKEEYERIRQLCILPNCCPFRSMPKYDDALTKYVVICRPYQRHTLSDRLSTRPFIVPIERHWFIYQILRALSQCHSVSVCHGDLKSQNVVLSSSGWLQITDFAFFKPTYLPEDDPSIYSYFFDTSRRQTCYIAPERILSPLEYKECGGLSSTKLISDGLKPSMDIFSAACVIVELFNDGHPPFSYAQLFKYRKMTKAEAEKYVDELVSRCAHFAPILRRMLSRDPKKRPTADMILSDPTLFPYMITYQYNYMNVYRPKDISRSSSDDISTVMEADDVIAKLLHDEDNIISRISSPNSPSNSAVFFVSLITCNLRAVRCASSRISAMRFLVRISRYASASISFQRILPYLVTQMQDAEGRKNDKGEYNKPSSLVSSYAIEAIAHLLTPLTPDSLEDSLIFIEYLFPRFSCLVEKTNSSTVLLSLSKYLGRFAQSSLNFYRLRKEGRLNKDDDMNVDDSQEDVDERKSLSQSMSNLFSSLHTREEEIKSVLVRPSNLKRLYAFFEVFGSPDVLFSHLVTMLNNGGWNSRASLFDTLPLIVKNSDNRSQVLIEQGLSDIEEVVNLRALSCARILLLSHRLPIEYTHCKLIQQTIPFLLHPNESIRGETAELIVAIDKTFSIADVHSKLVPLLQPFLKTPLIRFNNKTVILCALIRPIDRSLWKEAISIFTPNGVNDILKLPFKDSLKGDDIHKLGLMHNCIEQIRRCKTKDFDPEGTLGEIDIKNVEKKERSLNTMRTATDSFVNSSNVSSMRISPFDAALEDLIVWKKNELERKYNRLTHPSSYSSSKGAISSIKGDLVMHLHEHCHSINQMSLIDDGSRLSSCSSDGSFKIWSTTQLGGDSYGAVRADATYSFKSNKDGRSWPLSGIGWAQGETQLVVSSTSGELLWIDSSTQVKEISRVCLPNEDGAIEQMITHGNITFVRSHHGTFYCYDSRVGKCGGSKHEVWRKKGLNSQGKITSFCVDPLNATWMVSSGTSNDIVITDLRLLTDVITFIYPSKGRPAKVWSHINNCYDRSPLLGAQIMIGNAMCDELSLFNITTGYKSDIWWPSQIRKPLDYSSNTTTDLNRAVSAVCVDKGGWILIGDTKGEIRKWNYIEPTKSAYICGIGHDSERDKRIRYKKEVDDVNQIVATIEDVDLYSNYHSKSNKLEITRYHRTGITDMISLPSNLIVSSSSDGCIKVWS